MLEGAACKVDAGFWKLDNEDWRGKALEDEGQVRKTWPAMLIAAGPESRTIPIAAAPGAVAMAAIVSLSIGWNIALHSSRFDALWESECCGYSSRLPGRILAGRGRGAQKVLVAACERRGVAVGVKRAHALRGAGH